MDEKIISCGENILDQCLLPELPIEIGNEFLPATYFTEFHKILEITLPQLFDFIASHEALLLSTESSTIDLRCKFLRLLLEQTCPRTDFQVPNQKLLNHLQSLLIKYFEEIIDADSDVEEKLWSYYKTNLQAKKWRKQLGASYGFPQFLKLQYVGRIFKELKQDNCLFILSTSLLFKEIHEEAFKNLSMILLEILLTKSRKSDIEALNIHNVVFENLILEIPKLKNIKDVELLWNCLLQCVKLMPFQKNYEWNRIDDLIENALKQIVLESNWEIHQIQLLTISKLCIILSADKEKIMPLLNIENISQLFEDSDKIRDICSQITVHSSLRWAKKILDTFVLLEIPFLLKENAIIVLQTMHMTYLVCIFPIPLNVLKHILPRFIEKFIPSIIKAVHFNQENKMVKKVCKDFCQTILYQIDNSTYSLEDMEKYKIAIEAVLANETFINL